MNVQDSNSDPHSNCSTEQSPQLQSPIFCRCIFYRKSILPKEQNVGIGWPRKYLASQQTGRGVLGSSSVSKALAHKHKDPSLMCKTDVESWVWSHTLVIPALGRRRQVDSKGSLVSQTSLMGKFPVRNSVPKARQTDP